MAACALSCSGCARALGPSDCLARDADSTCNQAIARAADPDPVALVDSVLYDGPLAGVPAQGYAYWGFDFLAEARGVASTYGKDMYVNHSPYTAIIRLTFNIPTSHPCNADCRPGVEFFVGPSWASNFPAYVVDGDTVWLEYRAPPGQSYGWAIGLWSATNPRLTVSVDPGVRTTLTELGLPEQPGIALEIPAVTTTCTCIDNSVAACSQGSHFTNGLDGQWFTSASWHYYVRAGAFNDCLTLAR